MNPELKDPVNLLGAVLSAVGGALMFTILFDFPEWMMYAGFILWVIGIAVLIIHSAQK